MASRVNILMFAFLTKALVLDWICRGSIEPASPHGTSLSPHLSHMHFIPDLPAGPCMGRWLRDKKDANK
jgi:hypothetical protein